MRSAILTMVLAAGGLALAHHDERGDDGANAPRRVRLLSQKEITEKLDGEKTTATTVEVTLGPGNSDAPQRHPGPAFGYVLEGEYEWAIDDQPLKTLKVGDTFYEPTACLHRVSRNPGKQGKTRILAVVLHSADVKDIVIPENEKK